jgi:cytochrome P450
VILATTERLFAERGIHAVSNRQISEAAGQGNSAAVGYHFGTKADLVRAIARRAGEGLIMVNEMGNRDPEVFPEPDRLDIRRDARRHVTFGFGVHQCLGQPLARMELQVVYGTLYRRVPTLKLATELERMPFKYDGLVYGVFELPVTW